MTGEYEFSDEEIKERMSSNLCRCGAYNGIVNVVRGTFEPTFRRCAHKCCIFENDVNAAFGKHDSITNRYQGTGY